MRTLCDFCNKAIDTDASDEKKYSFSYYIEFAADEEEKAKRKNLFKKNASTNSINTKRGSGYLCYECQKDIKMKIENNISSIS